MNNIINNKENVHISFCGPFTNKELIEKNIEIKNTQLVENLFLVKIQTTNYIDIQIIDKDVFFDLLLLNNLKAIEINKNNFLNFLYDLKKEA